MFFSSDVANPTDTYTKLYCDMEMYTTTQPQPDPERFLNQLTSWEIASKENKWLGRNVSRYSDPEADKAYRAAPKELDPAKRAVPADQGQRDLLRSACPPAAAHRATGWPPRRPI